MSLNSVVKPVSDLTIPNTESYSERVLLESDVYHLSRPSVVQNDCTNWNNDKEMGTLPVTLQEIPNCSLYFNGPRWYAADSKGDEIFRSWKLDEEIPKTKKEKYHCYESYFRYISPSQLFFVFAAFSSVSVYHRSLEILNDWLTIGDKKLLLYHFAILPKGKVILSV